MVALELSPIARHSDDLPFCGAADCGHSSVETKALTADLDLLGAGIPHHSGSILWILELLDQARDLSGVSALGHDGIGNGFPQRQVLDPLCCPVGLDLFRWHAPDLFSVGLKERAVEAPAKPAYHPALEVGDVFRRANPSGDVGANTRECLNHSQIT